MSPVPGPRGMSTLSTLREMAEAAERRIRDSIRETPLERSATLSDAAGCEVSLKLENFQETGSFKFRGALSKLASMGERELARGIVTASTGNHGLACAHAATLVGAHVEIVLPEGAPSWRVEKLRTTGATIHVHGAECTEAEAWARAEADRTGQVYLPPYNDMEVIAGHATIALELLRQTERLDAVSASVGGGGLISGVAGALKDAGAAPVVLGCLPENSPAMYDSVRAGRIVRSEVRPTLSDSTAGNVEEGAVTFDLCSRYVDEWTLVSENEILETMEMVYREHDLVVEGAAGVAVAGFLKSVDRLGLNPASEAVIIVCGGNVSPTDFAGIVVPREANRP